VDRKRHHEFPPVKIVLLVRRQPHSRRHFVSLLHEIAASINLRQKQRKRNVFGNLAFDLRQLRSFLVDPQRAPHLAEQHFVSCRRLERGIPRHFVLHQRPVSPHLLANRCEHKCFSRRVDQVIPFLFSPFRFRVRFPLRRARLRRPDQRRLQLFQRRPVTFRARGFRLRRQWDLAHSRSRGKHPPHLHFAGIRVASGFSNLHPFHPLVDVQFRVHPLLVRNHPAEQVPITRGNFRGRLLRWPGLSKTGQGDQSEAQRANRQPNQDITSFNCWR